MKIERIQQLAGLNEIKIQNPAKKKKILEKLMGEYTILVYCLRYPTIEDFINDDPDWYEDLSTYEKELVNDYYNFFTYNEIGYLSKEDENKIDISKYAENVYGDREQIVIFHNIS